MNVFGLADVLCLNTEIELLSCLNIRVPGQLLNHMDGKRFRPVGDTGMPKVVQGKKTHPRISANRVWYKKYNGEGGIRTRGTEGNPYDGLANRCLKPLGHLSKSLLYRALQKQLEVYFFLSATSTATRLKLWSKLT